MSADSLQSAPDLPLVQAYHPTTFLERGVAVPFTTPALQGARARPPARGGLEIIVPNPSGGRGVYILPWAGVRQLCRPTVHDTLLSERVAALRSVTPAAMRQVACEVAAEGFAGRSAQAAAGTAAKGDREDRLTANFLLLLALTEQVYPADLGALSTERASPRELEQRARRAVARVGPRIGRSPEAVAEALEQLAEAFAGIGVPRQAPAPRMIRLLDGLARLRADMLAWSKENAGDSAAQAEMVSSDPGVFMTDINVLESDSRTIPQTNQRYEVVFWRTSADGNRGQNSRGRDLMAFQSGRRATHGSRGAVRLTPPPP